MFRRTGDNVPGPALSPDQSEIINSLDCNIGPRIVKANTFIVHVIVPLSAGIAIYTLWRSLSLRVFHWLTYVGVMDAVHLARQSAEHTAEYIPEWCLFSLPDGLWAYSFCACIILAWNRQNDHAFRAWYVIAAALGPASELGQYSEHIPGTFELMDLACYSIGALLPLRLLHQRTAS